MQARVVQVSVRLRNYLFGTRWARVGVELVGVTCRRVRTLALFQPKLHLYFDDNWRFGYNLTISMLLVLTSAFLHIK